MRREVLEVCFKEGGEGESVRSGGNIGRRKRAKRREKRE